MSRIYHEGQRELQREFDSVRLADRLEQVTWRTRMTAEDRAFIESRDMFFLATADAEGRPNCSYKGGDPGFVRVLDEATIAFPSYDGNGMFLSFGNACVNPHVGLLFIDFETPKRLRLNGEASIEPRRRAHVLISRGAVHRAGARARGVSELPALHPQVSARRALEIHAAERAGNADTRLEAL